MVKKVIASVVAASIIGVAAISQTTSATSTPATCVNGGNFHNLTLTWTGKNTVNISVKDNKKVCDDTTIYLSSYVMPDTWDGKGFNQTAVPQTLHKSVSTTLKAGTSPSVMISVTMPEACKNTQTDLYYGPEQTSISMSNKIGSRLISSFEIKGTGQCGGQGGGTPTTVPVPPAPTKAPAVLPATLPSTGSSVMTSIVTTLLAAGTTLVAAYRIRK